MASSDNAPTAMEIVFDGGSLNNPGHGYGSYRLTVTGEDPQMVRLDFGSPVTNNEAEYRALIAGLEHALREVQTRGLDPTAVRVQVRGDSQLVLKQVGGQWKVKMAHLQPLRAKAAALVAQLGNVVLTWQPRAASVRILGH
jgi:ribonuclease HI